MWYSVDIQKLGKLLLPPMLRKAQLMALVDAFLYPLKELHYEFTRFREDTIYKIEHTWQKCYMRGALNDRFDPSLRRIYIADASLYDTTYIYTEAEMQPEPWLYTEAEEETIWLYTEAETADTGVNFIVYVPAAIVNTQIHELNALIEFYKLGGLKYRIEKI